MNVRDEVREDWEAVSDLHHQAFGDHGKAVAALVDDLRLLVRGEDGLSLVAEQAGQILGHVMLTRSLLDAPDRLVEVQMMSPVGVLPARQRRGIGSALIRHALQIMTDRHVPVVFLEGSSAYDSRFGFQAGARLGFRKPSLRIPDAAFQALRLPAYGDWMVGTLVYAEAFWRHDAVGLRPQST
jgi:putative acetyltransferase